MHGLRIGFPAMRAVCLLLAAFAMLTSAPALAQLCAGIPGLVVNGSLEQPDIGVTPPTPVATFGSPPTAARIYDQSDIPGWGTTASDGGIEIWQSGHNSVASFAGGQHAELNAFRFGALFQDLVTTPGSTIVWQFAHRGRAGVDTVRVEIGPPGGALTNVGEFSTDNTAWDIKSGIFTIPAGQTTTRFQFTAVATASGSSTVGNFLDDVRIFPLCDYGDAASSFPVTRANGGAAHSIASGVFLGGPADAESDGQPSFFANADDAGGSDDEDGVSFGLGGSGELIRRARNPITVNASVPGFINLWVDLNGDGTWQASERIFADQSVSSGSQTLFYRLPASASPGARYARIRFSTDNPSGAMGPGGDWPNGEVEDYRVTITTQGVLEITKSSDVFVDVTPTDPPTAPFFVPDNDVTYTLTVRNIGEGAIDNNSVFVVDTLPPQVVFFNGDANGTSPGTGRVIFADGGTGLAFDPNSDVRFSSSAFPPSSFAACTYTPNAGYDPAVRHICFRPRGSFPSSPSEPSLDFSFRARIN